MRPSLAALSLVLLAACSGPPAQRFAVPAVGAGERIGIGVRSLEVVEVSLPTYARSEEIWRETPGGALESDPKTLWADEPTRGMTQELSRQLSALTGARVAAEPWPFDEPAAARLEVRVDEMVAGADGRFRLSGQFYTTRRSGDRDRATAFAVSAPIAPESGARGIAAARGLAVRDLARKIAASGL